MATIQLAPVHTRLLKTWTILANVNLASSPHTGDTAAFTLASFTVPGGSMGPNGRLRITALYSFVGTAGTKTCLINFGGIQVWGIGGIAAVNLGYSSQFSLINRNSQAAQIAAYNSSPAYGPGPTTPVTAAIDTSVDRVIDFRCQNGSAADSATLETYLIEVLYGA